MYMAMQLCLVMLPALFNQPVAFLDRTDSRDNTSILLISDNDASTYYDLNATNNILLLWFNRLS